MGIIVKHLSDTTYHHVCCCCPQEGQEGPCCSPSLCQHDHRCYQGSGRQEGIFPPGHPQVCRGQQQGRCCQGCCPCPSCSQENDCCQESSCCCCCWQKGSCQEGKEAKEGCQETSS